MLKDLFADTIEDMLKAELDTELGYGIVKICAVEKSPKSEKKR